MASIKRVRRLPIHDENFAFGDHATALPDRQRSTSTVALAGLAQSDVVEGGREPIPANGLPPRQRQHALQLENAAWQIAAYAE
jgi:hypothetical protein